MYTFDATRILPYPQDDLYTLVTDIHAYPSFLPWCVDACVRTPLTDGSGRPSHIIEADLTVGTGWFHETFRSTVELTPTNMVRATCQPPSGSRSPLQTLEALWHFTPVKNLHQASAPLSAPSVTVVTRVTLTLCLTFRNAWMESILVPLLQAGQSDLLQAFEERARQKILPKIPLNKT